MARDFHDGYIATYTAGIEHTLGDLTAGANYVATAGVGLPRVDYPNGYGGADAGYAPYTAYGPIALMTSPLALHLSFAANFARRRVRCVRGWAFRPVTLTAVRSTTPALCWAASSPAPAELCLQTAPQNPRNQRAEKRGPPRSTFLMPSPSAPSSSFRIDRIAVFRRSKRWSTGWQLLALGSIASGRAVHRLFGNSADRSGLERQRPSRPDRAPGIFHRTRNPRGLFRTRRQQRLLLRDPDQSARQAPAPMRAASVRWDATPSAVPASATWMFRWSKIRRWDAARTASAWRCNSAPRSSMFSTW